MASTKLLVLQFCTILLLGVCFTILMISMTTHSWRGNDKFKHPLIPAPFDIHHGLWYKCIHPFGECIKLEDGTTGDDSTLRGNITRGLFVAALFLSFLSTCLLMINICVSSKKKVHFIALVASLVMTIFAFFTGMAGMVNFTDYFPHDGAPWSEYRYSYVLGWLGSALFIIPTTLLCVQIALYNKRKH